MGISLCEWWCVITNKNQKLRNQTKKEKVGVRKNTKTVNVNINRRGYSEPIN